MDGIFLGPVCCGDTCRSNEIGIVLEWSDSNTVANNTCNSNDIGIYLHESDFNTVANNNCTDNRIGIYLEESYLDTGDNNTFSGNTEHDMVDESELRELARREYVAKQSVWFLAGCGMIIVVSVIASARFRRMEIHENYL